MGRVASVPLLICAMSLAACATNVPKPSVPDNSALQPAYAAINKAQAAGAVQLAPEALREAQRRADLAESILYQAAINQRAPNAAEKLRVERLVEEAGVDARLALALTQQEAVGRKRTELQGTAEGTKDVK